MKKISKTIAVALLWASTCFTAYWVGTQTWIFDVDGIPHHYTSQEAEFAERRIAGNALKLLHRFYGNDDNEMWFDLVMPSQEYKDLDNALEGDWEDFYCYQEEIFTYDN